MRRLGKNLRGSVIPLTASENYGARGVQEDVIQGNRVAGHWLEFDRCDCREAVRRMIAGADVLVAHHQTIATYKGRTHVTTTATFADQRDEFNAALAQQAPAQVLEGFGRIIADQTAVDYAARAPKVGHRAPNFTLPDQVERQVSLAGEVEQGPVVLIFYRGEWCPYCNMMLRTYGLRAADFSERGARLVAVSPQTPDNSLTMAEKHSLEFPVLSDAGGEVIGTYGLKYDVDGQSRQLLEAVGNDVATFNGDGGWILPAPAVFVIDREGIVRFVGVNGDYTQRVEPDEALAALDSLDS